MLGQQPALAADRGELLRHGDERKKHERLAAPVLDQDIRDLFEIRFERVAEVVRIEAACINQLLGRCNERLVPPFPSGMTGWCWCRRRCCNLRWYWFFW